MDSFQFNTILQRFDTVDTKLNDLATRALVGAARSLVHEEILQQLAASIGRIDQYAARTDASLAEHAERLARMDERIAQNEVRIAQNEDLLRQHDGRMARLAAILQAIRDLLERGNGR